MAIFVDENTKLVVQGITGRDGSFHTTQMIEYGTQVVAGVTPGKAGQSFAGPKGEKIPIFNSMDSAVAATGANTSVIYVPPAFAGGAIMEAADAGVEMIVAITEGVPVLDMARVHAFARDKGARVLGPNCPGLISPGKCKVGILPGQIVTPGPVGVISRSGTLTYEAVYHLTNADLGQTTCVGIGGDPLIGTTIRRLPGSVRWRSRDPSHRNDRRNRRNRRTGGGFLRKRITSVSPWWGSSLARLPPRGAAWAMPVLSLVVRLVPPQKRWRRSKQPASRWRSAQLRSPS